jgi:hypothetical protein
MPAKKELIEEAPIVTSEDTSEVEVETAVEAVTSKLPTRKVRGIKDHFCTIGGQKIIITKDRETVLSVDAAQVLQRAGKVLIL